MRCAWGVAGIFALLGAFPAGGGIAALAEGGCLIEAAGAEGA
jgi:hypothetical protein